MACLLVSIVAAWGGLGPHFGGLRDIRGMACVPDWPGEPRMGWIHSGAGGRSIQGTAKVDMNLLHLGFTINYKLHDKTTTRTKY